jgi:hypothetical protein
MKKVLSALVVALALVSTVGCGGSATTGSSGTKK